MTRTWCYTLNNPTDKDINQFKLFDCNRHRCCLEIGESGTPHLQGKITFQRTYRAAALKKLNEKTHWEIAITKDFNYETKGEIIIDTNPQQGKRTDLTLIASKIKEGTSMKEIADEFPNQFIRYHKGFEKIQQLNSKPRNWEMQVHIRWGKTGTGKSRYVWETHGYENVYPKPKNKWWDHYTGQEVVLIDDFDPNSPYDTFDEWLRLFDRYPYLVEFKGGSCHFSSKIIYITSNFNPDIWFRQHRNRDALFRRIVTVTEVTDR